MCHLFLFNSVSTLRTVYFVRSTTDDQRHNSSHKSHCLLQEEENKTKNMDETNCLPGLIAYRVRDTLNSWPTVFSVITGSFLCAVNWNCGCVFGFIGFFLSSYTLVFTKNSNENTARFLNEIVLYCCVEAVVLWLNCRNRIQPATSVQSLSRAPLSP